MAQLIEVFSAHYARPEYLASLQVLLNMDHDPRTSSEVRKTMLDVAAQSNAHVRRLLREALGPAMNKPDLVTTIFLVIRGFGSEPATARRHGVRHRSPKTGSCGALPPAPSGDFGPLYRNGRHRSRPVNWGHPSLTLQPEADVGASVGPGLESPIPCGWPSIPTPFVGGQLWELRESDTAGLQNVGWAKGVHSTRRSMSCRSWSHSFQGSWDGLVVEGRVATAAVSHNPGHSSYYMSCLPKKFHSEGGKHS